MPEHDPLDVLLWKLEAAAEQEGELASEDDPSAKRMKSRRDATSAAMDAVRSYAAQLRADLAEAETQRDEAEKLAANAIGCLASAEVRDEFANRLAALKAKRG